MALPASRVAAIPDRNWVNIQWLARLRWAEIAGQAATVLVGQFLLDGALPMAHLLAVIAVGLVSNLAIELYYFGDRRRSRAVARPVHERQIALVMMLDIAVLTGLLYFTGGPHNPFAFLYVVQIALATVLVRALWSWMLVGLSFVGFGILLIANQPLDIPDDRRMVGAWVALGVASAFVLHFLRRITGALAERDAELTEARGLAARQERLASLATMAAGAAHELSTPLGTVALAAKELERALTRTGAPELVADARLIREQVGRCRAILEQMAQGAGTVGEGVTACTIGELLDEALVGARAAPGVHRDVPPELARVELRLPPRAVSQALRSLITNAQDASPADAAVVVSVRGEGAAVELAIRDRGQGMPTEILARIGEPFFTTKPPGSGMGLGLFLARAVIEAVGGALDIESSAGAGTCVRVALPTDVSYGGAKHQSRESIPPGMVSKPA
ncbi:MAG: HAMP domain-containing histidine kinase [Deltaproteobacteria bacterium]|nr:MAG: HAMP domain-containing histidine kinase [Deltaproteobacteria bacterium]TMQ21839.1 MAG: HAMP domain-containing histidine kinase [Deltaproteobacteria bacterium]